MAQTETGGAPLAPPPRFLGWPARHAYAVLALLCLALWLPGILSLPALDRDESRFAQSSRQMLESGNYIDIRFGHVPRYKKPAGIYWLQAAATAAAGGGDHSHIWTYRLPSLLGGVAAVWLTFWCASALAGAEAAFLAALLLGASILLTAEATIATTDAVLLATVLGVQGVLLRVYRAARRADGPPPSTALVLAGWASLAVGILIKGPVTPAVAVVTVVALAAWDWLAQDRPAQDRAAEAPDPPTRWDSIRWLSHLQPAYGILLTVALVAPWLIAITLQSHGTFFQQSLGGDFAAKIAGGQESHGAPPGYFLVLSSIAFWPAILFVAPGIGLAVLRRAEPGVRFLLAWAGASWLMFEAVPTKLPNYVLPAYPALAILAALWLIGPPAPAVGWRRFLPWVSALQFLLGLTAMAAALLSLPGRYGQGAHWPVIAAAGVTMACGVTALILFLTGRRLAALLPAFAAVVVAVPVLTTAVAPGLTQLWVSERLAALVAKDRLPGDPPPALAGYEEPSLVFALGPDVGLTDGAGAAGMGANGGGLALVEDRERAAFLARLAELEADAAPVDDLSGFNYSRGKPVHVTIYRVAPLHPTAQPRVR